MALKAPARPYCLGTPSMYRCLIVKLNTTKQIVQRTEASDFSQDCIWFDVRGRGFELSPVTFTLRAGITWYFVESEFAGYFYVLRYFEDLQRFGCSCKMGKQGQRCVHAALLGPQRSMIENLARR
ncbi:MAG TPA: hypothetical protein VKR06_10105 [Ktedonosporobacter sp.]|nr:hypothetical protein [Ktedonosporobacter sp.]